MNQISKCKLFYRVNPDLDKYKYAGDSLVALALPLGPIGMSCHIFQLYNVYLYVIQFLSNFYHFYFDDFELYEYKNLHTLFFKQC